MSSDTVPTEIQERLEALEVRRLEIISENASDRAAAGEAFARIAERKAEKTRLKIEARALRMAVDAFVAERGALRNVKLWVEHDADVHEAEPFFASEDAPQPQEAPVDPAPEVAEAEQPGEQEFDEWRPPLSQQVLRALTEANGPLTRRDIAQATGEDPDQISTTLTHMKRRGLVTAVEKHGWALR